MRRLADRSIRVRITVRTIIGTTVLTLGGYLVALALMRLYVLVDLRGDLATEARQVAATILADRLQNPVITGNGTHVQVLDRQGEVLAASRSVQGRPPRGAARPGPYERVDQRACDRGRCYVVVSLGGVGGDTVYAFASEPGLLPRPGWSLLLGLCVPLIAVGYSALKWRAIGRILRPVDDITDELQRITATDLNRRVPVPPQHDETRHLAEIVNGTLDRLERSVVQQRQFVSDVSHELRSPITGLRAELELAQLEPRRFDPDTALNSVDRLADTVADLLVLARRDAGMARPTEPVDLGELAGREAACRVRRVPVEVIAEPGVVVSANGLDLDRVLTNLFDNGARHAESEVVVTVRRDGGDAVVEVRDDGAGVPPEDREKIFDRFVRLADGRRRDPGGTGLGLAISRSIAAAYDGTLGVADSDVGARFVLRLPALEE